jgi:hypothetical protein
MELKIATDLYLTQLKINKIEFIVDKQLLLQLL